MKNAASTKYCERFWCPLEGRRPLDNDGFLAVRDDPRLHKKLSDVVSFDEIEYKSCLLLVGEPGIGKSTVIRELAERPPKDTNLVEETIFINLGVEREPEKKIFEDTRFKRWLQGECYLWLFLDSLDECAEKDFSSKLVAKLQEGPVKILRLRIACRTSELPPFLNGELSKLWTDKDLVGIYELAPLRKQDVVHIAGANGEIFVKQVIDARAGALASRPVTLNLLLNQFKRQGQLQQEPRWKIYLNGCLILCDDQDVDVAHQRLVVASRIAAVCLLAQRSAVQVMPNLGNLSSDAITSEEIAVGFETIHEGDVKITAELVRATLETRLFQARGDNLKVFAHQTYLEFLTAFFLRHRKLSPDDIATILMPGGKVVPSLSEVAAWIATQDKAFKAKLLVSEPQVLLRSDIALADADEKRQLVDALLERFERQELLDLHVRDGFNHLAHPGLAAQLEPVIKNRHASFIARRAAIMMVEACALATLQPTLADVAFSVDAASDPKESYWLRVNAVRAIVELHFKESAAPADEIVAGLQRLAHDQGGDDPDDELKGYALHALWRKSKHGRLINAEELFACLRPMTREFFFGAYFTFITSGVVDSLTDDDLPVAIRWAQNAGFKYGEQLSLQGLSDAIVRRAWPRMANPSVRSALVSLVRIRFDAHDGLFYRSHDDTGKVLSNEEHKKLLVQEIVETTPPLQHEYFSWKRNGLLPHNDVEWMLQRLREVDTSSMRERWSSLIADAWGWAEKSVEIVEALLDARLRYDELKQALGPRFLFFDLDDADVQQERKEWLEFAREEREREKRRKKQPLPKPPAEQTAICLDRIDAGDVEWFWQLPFRLWQDGRGKSWDGHQADLTESPGWHEASEKDRARILNAALAYLAQYDAKPSEWLGKRVTYWPAVAGYLALWLLHKEELTSFEAMESELWKRWAAIVIDYRPAIRHEQDKKVRNALVTHAYRKASQECLDTMNVLLDMEKQQEHSSDPSRVFDACWSEEIGAFLLNKVKDATVGPVLAGILLEQTLKHDAAGAYEYAQEVLRLPLPEQPENRIPIKAVARALFRGAADAGWPLIWPILKTEPDFGRELMLAMMEHVDPDAGDLWTRLPEQNAADAYIWLEKHFPRKEETDDFGGRVQAVTARDNIKWARNGLLKQLAQRGTVDAVKAIEHINDELPEDDSVAWELLVARQYKAQKAMRALTPRDVLAIGQLGITNTTQDPANSSASRRH